MAYADQGMSKGKMIGLGVAVFVHILLGYAFVTGLALKAVKTIVGPLETVNIKAETPPPDEPPPPPPKDVEIPPFVPPPEVTVQSDAPPPPTITIQNYAPPRCFTNLRRHLPHRRVRRRPRSRSATARRFRKTIIRRPRCAPRSRDAR
jgi:hypothetical protein